MSDRKWQLSAIYDDPDGLFTFERAYLQGWVQRPKESTVQRGIKNFWEHSEKFFEEGLTTRRFELRWFNEKKVPLDPGRDIHKERRHMDTKRRKGVDEESHLLQDTQPPEHAKVIHGPVLQNLPVPENKTGKEVRKVLSPPISSPAITAYSRCTSWRAWKLKGDSRNETANT